MLGSFFAMAAAVAPASGCNTTHVNATSLQNIAVLEIPGPTADKNGNTQDDAAKLRSLATEMVNPGLPSGGEVLGYTRLRIKFTACATGPLRSYSEESRSPLERFFIGKSDNHVLKFEANVEPLGVKVSSQLYSMLRNSAKDGQSWSTDIRNDDYLLPYFRVDQASVLNFSANFQSEGSSKVEIGSAVLEIVERGSKLISPSALLITDENKPRFNEAAGFVDESLSKLFYKRVSETARQGIAIDPTEAKEKLLVSILLTSPHPTKTYITDQRHGRIIGKWDVYAEPLLKSLFAPVHNNVADVGELDPATVLNFKIGDKEVLRDRLASSEAIAKASQLLAKASDANVAEPAIGVCRLVAMEAARVGLAPFDIAIATWAHLEDQGMAGDKAKAARNACGPVLRSLKLPS